MGLSSAALQQTQSMSQSLRTSPYAGLGLYERTEGGLVPGQLQRNFQRTILLPTLGIRERTIQQGLIFPGLLTGTISRQRERTLLIPREALIPRLTTERFTFVGTPIRPRFDIPGGFIFPFGFLGLESRKGRGSSLFGRFYSRYSPSLTSRTFGLFGRPSKRALRTGVVTPFERRYLLGRSKRRSSRKRRRG